MAPPNGSETPLMDWEAPRAQGLYDPSNEHEACGVGFIVAIDGKESHKILRDAQTLSTRMNHRGACACDNDTGDGAGVLAAIPHNLYADELAKENIALPEFGKYATGIFYLDKNSHKEVEKEFQELADSIGLAVIGWRDVPVDSNAIGQVALKSEPLSRQVFITAELDEESLNKQVYILRKRATHELQKPGRRFYICSLSLKTVVYKGLFTSDQLWLYYLDLANPKFLTYLALVHTRFSTNTFPSWERAHPLRVLAHNGEINTLRGNVNYMKAREGIMKSDIFGDELAKLYPVVEPNLSDSGSADCVLEFLTMAGNRPLPEAVMTMVPEAWQNDKTMSDEKRDFYHWAACVMEPWDGPALISFTDGRYIGAILDRNGLRPSRYYITSDNILVMASEVGVYDVDPKNVVHKSRLKPGRMLLVDTQEKQLIQDVELKSQIARSRPHSEWLKEQMIYMDDIRHADKLTHHDNPEQCVGRTDKPGIFDTRLPLYGYSTETIHMLLVPMIQNKKEALGSMGNDAPLACLSHFQPVLYEYFKQLFAQVTNPPIDPFREKVVMSLKCPIGPEANILDPSPKQVHRVWLNNPILSIGDTNILKRSTHRGWKTKVIDLSFPVKEGTDGYVTALTRIATEAEKAARNGYQLIVLSDRNGGRDKCPVSALLSLGAVHHHLIETRLRMKVSLIVETAEAREVHHMCVLLGYGADAICPYLVFELAYALRDDGVLDRTLSDSTIFTAYSTAIETGISKVMAKMGISTLQSYKGAQIFEAVGIGSDVIDQCFRGTNSRLGGVSLKVIADDGLRRHLITYGPNVALDMRILRNPGQYHWRAGGEAHINEPAAIAALQEAAVNENKNAYLKFRETTMKSAEYCTLRGQLEFVKDRQKIDISEVEPASEIVKRFATGAMSFGSISLEAHSTLAVTMNRIGGKSNTGEGGENADRYLNQDPQNNQRSAIKQVASGRFGVTAAYLANADDLQIKMAQGAKPGEGGELPGYKVSKDIAAVRHSVPGVGLISPPPHHDIYSIEDLAELIYDLKCSNPKARISVKLVSEVGVGVVASGVAKGKAEHIVISGHDGGTGASSWTGIKAAGLPWELGVAETHQVLTLNNLRSRVIVQADGQLRTGFDVTVAALLGADEFGFSTAPLIVMGCTMMRKCHLNTCPVGIATQDPVLREKFSGKPEHVINFFFMLAEDIREIMASLGIRRFQELVGRTDLLTVRKDVSEKSATLDLQMLLKSALDLRPGTNIVGGSVKQDFVLENRLDNELIRQAQPVIDGTQNHVDVSMVINNEVRAFASTLSFEVASRFGDSLPEGRTINVSLTGSAGQSFCAFLVGGVTVKLIGDSNDYVGKGLCGGTVIITPPPTSPFESHLNVIVGNVCLYGATSGKAFFRGIAAERFCVRNSGVTAVVEGVGDHGCEYMTGGLVVILGLTGRNFAAGMSGGIAYVYDIDGSFKPKVNAEMVELLPLDREDDKATVKGLLEEFLANTDSEIAKELLAAWPASADKFVKVFPYEYQRALKALEEERIESAISSEMKSIENGHNGVVAKPEPKIKDIEEAILDVALETKKLEKVLDKTRGFIKYKRETQMYRNAEERQKDYKEVYNFGHVRKNLRTQAARCMECGVPFCQSGSHGCPLGNIIPKWNDLVFHENWKEALNQLLQTNNFPEFTGRVCPAPCEGACVLGISEPPVTIKNIECSIIDKAFENGWITPNIPAVRTGKKVYIVGSGPSGLAAAAQLNAAGHLVTVFERNDRPGGLLQYGIPTMKLSKEVVMRRIHLMEAEGITFKCGVSVGKDVSANDLVKDCDALLLTTGATWPRDLPLANRSLNGIHFAMEFLEAGQKQQLGTRKDTISAEGKDVIVIGGGDTGCDCIATSLRQGAKSITSFEILPEPPLKRANDNPWPQWPKVFRVDYGHEEVRVKFGKDPRAYQTTVKEFIDDGQGNISGVNTINVEWTQSPTGAWSMKEVAGSEKYYPASLILLAMGFLGPEKAVPAEIDLPLDNRGNIKTTVGTYGTHNPKIFAAGDCRRGQSLVVWAISEGRQAARQVDTYLIGQPSALPGPGGVIDISRMP